MSSVYERVTEEQNTAISKNLTSTDALNVDTFNLVPEASSSCNKFKHPTTLNKEYSGSSHGHQYNNNCQVNFYGSSPYPPTYYPQLYCYTPFFCQHFQIQLVLLTHHWCKMTQIKVLRLTCTYSLTMNTLIQIIYSSLF